MIVADKDEIFLISGGGDVMSQIYQYVLLVPVVFAFSAAKALFKFFNLKAEELPRESLIIASEVCIYTNDSITTEVL